MRGTVSWLAWVLCAACIVATPMRAAAQEPEEEEESESPFEGEFVASTIFQAATAAVRLRSPLTFESHFFGVEDNEIGVVGFSWQFSWRGLRVAPGFAWTFGTESKPAPVVTARWSYERERWLTEGMMVQSLDAYLPEEVTGEHGEPEEIVQYAHVLDGVHVSARLGRTEIGPMVEHIQYREGLEWKGGPRVAWRVARHLSVQALALWPEAELRGGVIWKP